VSVMVCTGRGEQGGEQSGLTSVRPWRMNSRRFLPAWEAPAISRHRPHATEALSPFKPTGSMSFSLFSRFTSQYTIAHCTYSPGAPRTGAPALHTPRHTPAWRGTETVCMVCLVVNGIESGGSTL
jgi:hypothetical protein